jgi:hypothetical protein
LPGCAHFQRHESVRFASDRTGHRLIGFRALGGEQGGEFLHFAGIFGGDIFRLTEIAQKMRFIFRG